MKISIDLDGTLWAHMDFFRNFMKAIQLQNHKVGILTGHNLENKQHDIDKMIANRFPIPDFYYGKETDQDKATNGAYFKARKIKEENIDIHFDDNDYDNPETYRLVQQLGIQEKIFKVPHKGRGIQSE